MLSDVCKPLQIANTDGYSLSLGVEVIYDYSVGQDDTYEGKVGFSGVTTNDDFELEYKIQD